MGLTNSLGIINPVRFQTETPPIAPMPKARLTAKIQLIWLSALAATGGVPASGA